MKKDEFWALKDVSFKIKRGQSLGIIGPNGAGKTTLLKIIAGLIKPDAGSVVQYGRTVPLFIKGAGFSKILTGRENASINLALQDFVWVEWSFAGYRSSPPRWK